MADETLLAGLRDIRMPAPTPDSALADGAAAAAIGLALALAMAAVMRVFTRRPAPPEALARRDLAALRGLPPEERLLAQVRILRGLAGAAGSEPGGWLAALDRRFGTDFFTRGEGAALGGLYRPGLALDPDRLDAELDRLLAARRRRR
jgi:hypothetical protein